MWAGRWCSLAVVLQCWRNFLCLLLLRRVIALVLGLWVLMPGNLSAA